MLTAKASESHHVPSAGYFEACKKKYRAEPLTPADHEEIAFERIRTNELFSKGRVNRDLRRDAGEIRNAAMLAAYEGGESVDSIAKAYNWTKNAVRLAMKQASEARR